MADMGKIVETYRFTVHGRPVTCHITDGGYRDASPEEIERRIHRMQEVAGEILWNAEMRERKKETAGA